MTTGISSQGNLFQPNKFGLNYVLTIQGGDGAVDIVIQFPFTLEFTVARTNYSYTNTAQIRVYNLSDRIRQQIQFDQYVGQYLPPDLPQILSVRLQAGYGDGPNFPVIFAGNVTRAYSVREGVNFVTNIEAFDGGAAYTNAKTSLSYSSSELQADVIQNLINDLAPYGVSLGALSPSLLVPVNKGGAYSGSVLDALTDLTNGNFFIDNLVANALLPNETLLTEIVTITSDFGLLNTPVLEATFLELEILFEPRLVIGSQVILDSVTNPSYNGIHKVASISHHGVISGAVASTATTHIGMQKGVFEAVTSQVFGL